MARARIDGYGDIVLKLGTVEAAAIHTLLARVDETTNKDISDATLQVFSALDEVRDEMPCWPMSDSMYRFREGLKALVDPCKQEE